MSRRQIAKSAGIVRIDPDGAPNRHGYSTGPTARWWHAVDLITAGKWRELLQTQEFTEPVCIVQAVAFGCRYSHHADKAASGYLSIAEARTILRAVGATPGQTVTSFVVAQFGASLLGCAAGIPLGVLLFNTVVSNSVKDHATIALDPSVYAAVGIAAPLLYILVAIAPAVRLARRRVAPALVYE